MRYRLVKYRGKWAVAWTDNGSTRRYSTGETDKAVAERIAKRIVAELEKPPSTLIPEIWNACQKDKADRGQAIAKNMHYHWKALAPVFENMEAEAVTLADCRAYTKQRHDAGKAKSTIATELKHLRLVLNWAEKNNLISRAPFIEIPEESDPRDRYLTRAEFRKLLDAANAPHIKLAMILMVTTAGRVGAILDLTWDRVDFERGKIQLKTSERGKGRAMVSMNEQSERALEEAFTIRTSNYVVEYAGGPVKSVRKGIQNAAKRAKLDDVSPHVFRHTAAVWMLEDGEDMEVVSQFLGHRDTATTRKHYAKYSPEFLRKAASRLNF